MITIEFTNLDPEQTLEFCSDKAKKLESKILKILKRPAQVFVDPEGHEIQITNKGLPVNTVVVVDICDIDESEKNINNLAVLIQKFLRNCDPKHGKNSFFLFVHDGKFDYFSEGKRIQKKH